MIIHPHVSFFSSTRLDRVALNYLTTLSLMLMAVYFYCSISHHFIESLSSSWYLPFSGRLITTRFLLSCLVAFYSLALPFYYYFLPYKISSANIIFRYSLDCLFLYYRPMGKSEKQAFLYVLLKFIFVPFIVNILIAHAAEINNSIVFVSRNYHVVPISDLPVFYNFYVHGALMQLVFLVDVIPFFLGYLIDLPLFSNSVRSVDPTASGWFFCLACYPPFNQVTQAFFPSSMSDSFPSTGVLTPGVSAIGNLAVALSLLMYALCSVSLGLKASNLSSRGVVQTGLYSLIRHPAYFFKNLSWWISVTPIVYLLYVDGKNWFWVVFCMAAWTFIYAMRSITEERHMLLTDPDYAVYCTKVKYRFIPYLF